METINNINKISYEDSKQQTILKIADLLRNIKYGYIQITIQNSRIVQIDKTERFRLPVCQQTETDKSQI